MVCGDSWFASVQTTKEVIKELGMTYPDFNISSTHAPVHWNSRYISVVKTYHGKFPKVLIEVG